MRQFGYLLLAVGSTAPLSAQTPTSTSPTEAAPAEPAAQEPAVTASDDLYGDEEAIVVVGQRARGSVVGDIPPENVLDTRDIRATGATSISELLDAVSAQTGSARGRSGGRPVLLLNGQRISGFRELRDLPPEAIQRMEILPEEVALKYGYSADQRVVNIVLRQRFNSTTAEVRGESATDGGWSAGRLDATRLVIRNDKRTSVNARIEGNSALYESERDIAFDPAQGPDERDARTLIGAGQTVRLTATHNRPVSDTAGLTLTAEAQQSHGSSRFGLADFNLADSLRRDTTTTTLGLGSAFNLQKGDWRFSSTLNADYERSESESDRSLATSMLDDKSRSVRTSLAGDVVGNGPLLTLPGGKVNATLKVALSRLDLDAHARRRDLVSGGDPGRTVGEASANIDLPITKRDSAIGRLGLNLNAGVSELSDFGTLTSLGGGLHWAPTGRLNLLTSYTREEGAPTLQQLGNPIVETVGVPYFDAVRGETVDVTTVTGGNPALDADRRTVWKIGGNWKALEEPDLRLRAEFVHEAIDRPQIGFPAATPALEAAFPGRFTRDGTGQLVRVDLTPVNADRSRRDQVRWGFDFSKQLKSKTPSREQIQELRNRFASMRTQGRPPNPQAESPPAEGASTTQPGTPPREGTTPDGPPPSARPGRSGEGSGGFRGGGGGRGGGFFGGRNGGRLNLSMTHTVTLKDELEIAPGLPTLDYLHGEAQGSTGGRPRHTVELQGGYYNNGLGARVSANWRSATRVDSLTGPDLRFDDYATVDLRLFANLGERFELVSKSPFFFGSSVRFEVKNLFNNRPDVRGSDGITPFVFQADRLEPLGRTIGISFRKIFLPRRFMGGGRGGGRSGS